MKNRTRRILNVFVASPSDTMEEREIVKNIIQETNLNWSRNANVQLDYIGWDESVMPGVGSDPQDVINSSIDDDYDVFVCILKNRFGTPTPRAESGTEEEIKRALAKHKEDGASVKILMYFSNEAIAPGSLDLDQLSKVRVLKDSLPDSGVLYANFDSKADFETTIRQHLAAIVQEAMDIQSFAAREKIAQNMDFVAVESSESGIEKCDSGTDSGILDLFEDASELIIGGTTALGRISESTEELSDAMSEGTEKLESPSAAMLSPKEKKKLVNEVAAKLQSYAASSIAEASVMDTSFRESLELIQKAIPLSLDFPTQSTLDELIEFKSILSDARSTAEQSGLSIDGFMSSIEKLPRLTTNLNRARRSAVDSLAKINSGLTHFSTTLGAIEIQIDEVISSLIYMINDP